MSLVLRPATREDVPALLLVLSAVRTQGPVDGPVDGTSLASALPAVRVALVGEDVVGYSLSTSAGPVCVVDPAWQGQGVRVALASS